jgi:hypothetical protein
MECSRLLELFRIALVIESGSSSDSRPHSIRWRDLVASCGQTARTTNHEQRTTNKLKASFSLFGGDDREKVSALKGLQ